MGICGGDTTWLHNSLTGSGTWMSSDTTIARINSITGYVDAFADGYSVITHSFTISGIAYLATDTLTVYPVPSPGYIIGPDSICWGSSATLVCMDATGSAGYWSTDETYMCSISSSGVLTAHAFSGINLIYHTSVNSFGCSAEAHKVLSYHAIPYVFSIAGDADINLGTIVGYRSETHNGVDVWNISPGTTATLFTPTNDSADIIAFSTGEYVISMTSTNWCGSWTNDKIINVLPPQVEVASPSFTSFVYDSCISSLFGVMLPPHTNAYSLVTKYGDDYSDTTTIVPSSSTLATTFSHVYSTSGIYAVKQVLYDGTIPLDSVSYSFQHLLCSDLFLSFYSDINNNCFFDSISEYLNCFALRVAIDSNGIPKDTISFTGGLYYRTSGNVGDVYSFHIIGLDTSWHFSCAFGGVIYDTLVNGTINNIHKSIGIHFPVGVNFDLNQQTILAAGRHAASGNILISNLLTLPQNAIVTMNVSPKYVFQGAVPSPTSIVGNTVTWNTSALSASFRPSVINYSLNIPTSTWLIPGDTVHNAISVSPVAGDANPANNVIVRIDTVKSSFDPNHISVSPEGNILNGARLHYAIEFENDGNDTAQNIYVMDTLSDYLNLSTFRIEGASAAMNIAVLHSGGHNILKFEFPNIKLLDSTHHGRCTGTVFYNINAESGLADGTLIYAHAGIYFDDNPVVLTDSTINTILIPNISVATTTGDSICTGESVHLNAVARFVNTPHYHWYINSGSAGTDSSSLTIAGAHVGDTVKCILTTIMDDTVRSTSNSIVLINRGLPNAGSISGLSIVCAGANITLSETVNTGIWSSGSTAATVSAGVVSGVSAGAASISYSVTNLCGTSVAIHSVTVNPAPNAGTITGSPVICELATSTLTNTTSGGSWSSSSASTTVVGGLISGISSGTSIISYSVINSCGTAIDTMLVTVNPLPNAGTITGVPVVCESAVTTLNNVSTGGTWASSTSSATVTGGVVSGSIAGTSIISYSVTNSCGTAVDTMLVTVNPLPHAGTITGATSLCVTGTVLLSSTTTGGVWSSSSPSASVTGGTVTGVSVGSSVIYYTVTNSCGVATDSTLIVVYLMPVVAPISGANEVCAGEAIVLTDSVSGGAWSSSDPAIASVSGGTVTGVSTGSAIISYLLTNVCGAALTSASVHVLSNAECNTGIITTISGPVHYEIYPNPNTGSFILSGTMNSLSGDVGHFDVLDITGRVVYNGITQAQNGIINVQVELPAGTASGQYILRAVTGDTVKYFQFVIKK